MYKIKTKTGFFKLSNFRRIKIIKFGSRSRMRVANTHNNFSPLGPLEQMLWGEEVTELLGINWILFCEKVEKMNNFRRIYHYKCGSRSHMRVANTENRFLPPRISTHRNIHTLKNIQIYKMKKKYWICFWKSWKNEQSSPNFNIGDLAIASTSLHWLHPYDFVNLKIERSNMK